MSTIKRVWIDDTETTTVVNPAADLAITKSDSPDPVTVSQPLTYTLTVINHGPSAATGVTVTDPLPSTVTFVSASATQGSCSGTTTVTGVSGVASFSGLTINKAGIGYTVKATSTGRAMMTWPITIALRVKSRCSDPSKPWRDSSRYRTSPTTTVGEASSPWFSWISSVRPRNDDVASW